MAKERRRMPNRAPKRQRPGEKAAAAAQAELVKHGNAVVESFRMAGGTVVAMVPGDPDLPAGLQLSHAVVQLALIGHPAFMLDGGEKHYVTYLMPDAAINLGKGLQEAAGEAEGAPELEQAGSGLVLARRSDDVARAVAEAEQTDRLRSG